MSDWSFDLFVYPTLTDVELQLLSSRQQRIMAHFDSLRWHSDRRYRRVKYRVIGRARSRLGVRGVKMGSHKWHQLHYRDGVCSRE